MCCHCNSNPAQYERNRRFRHLVRVLGWGATGAKLPSAGLWLNASKSECDDTAAPRDFDWPGVAGWPPGADGAESHTLLDRGADERAPPISWSAPKVCGEPGAKWLVDDLILGQGFVRGRAAHSLRSIESHPSIPSFCRQRRRPTRAASVRPLGVLGVPVAGAEGRPKPKSIRGDQWRGKIQGQLRRGVPHEGRVEGGQSETPGSPWKSETRRPKSW